MKRPRVAVYVLALLLLTLSMAGSPPPAGSGGPAGYVPGELLVKFKPGVDPLAMSRVKAVVGATTLKSFLSKAEHWRLGPGVDVQEAIAALKLNSAVAYAEPNYYLKLDITPNDPRYVDLWGMNNTGQTGGTVDADIDADMAWNVSTGSPNVVVGVIDTGIDYNHPDLAANIWTNPGEIAGNGIDDDGNGFIDDIHGWDFYNNDADPFDDHGHGTHCSGTITGIGNNGIGVAGVAWNVKVMAVKFLSSGGSGSTAGAISAVDYTTLMGVDLTSNSWGGGSFSQALSDAIANAGAANIAFVAAAGNSGVDNDTSPHYPSSYDLPNIIAVAATDHTDAKASFSCWGRVSVDLAAPGVDILSTMPGNTYGYLSGTSMATPHVSGTCALIRSVSPNVPVAQMKSVLLGAVDVIPSMNGRVVSNGRLNAFRAIAEPDTTAPGAVDDLATADPGSNTMGLAWTATGDDGETGTAAFYEVRWSKDPIDETNFAAAHRAGNEPAPAEAGTPQSMEVGGLDASSSYFFALKAFDEWGNAGPISNLASGSTLPPPVGQVDPTSVSDALFTGQQSDHIVTLSNIGPGTLDFTIPSPEVGEPTAVQAFADLDLGKGEVDPRQGEPLVENSGGPDAFGYRWVDSDDPGGPVFNWTDISATGTPVGLTSDDATSGPLDLGFTMPFYGNTFSTIRVCTNGWLSFTSSLSSYSNQALPSGSAPENLVAPFWDDLNPGGTNRIFFQSFGNRAIVQWNQMPPYSGTGNFTFQAILDASGSITLQYLTMTGPLTSATVGIQDASKTVGLPIAFNQAYIHDNLAVRINSTPQWLSAYPGAGRLHAGESIPITVHMDASGLEGGTYPGAVNILSNDPVNPVLTVDVTLQVTGAPDIDVQPTSIDYGDHFIGTPAVATLQVINNGTDVLQVTGIVSSHPAELTAVPEVFDLPPHSSQDVTVTWVPTSLGPFSGSVTVQSNDAADPNMVVPVAGNSIPAPVMVVSPDSFAETLYSGQTVTRPLTVTNTGGSDLVVDALADQGDGLLVAAPAEGSLASGGPDAFGYRWKDSNESGGPAYEFIDISSTGTQISFTSSDDAVSAAISMGMTFPFYGNNFTQIKVCTNGWLTFDTTETSSRLSNYSLPNTSGAKNMLALFWDDLHLRTGNVKYLYDGMRFIVQYTNVEKYSPSGSQLTFQVQLYPNGKILYQYRTMAGTLNSATIGIQDQTKTIGLTANYNANYIASGMAIRFSRTPDWLTVTPAHQVIPPGGSFDFQVLFDANDRQGGVLNGNVVLNTNIPGQTQELVPCQLTVIGVPIVGLVPEIYNFGTQFTGYSYLTSFQVVNDGTDVLNVSDVYADDPTLSVFEPGTEEQPQAGFSLAPGAAKLLNLRWYPLVPMTLNAGVHVLSDDPVDPDKVMPVTGVAILPPVAVSSPDSFSEVMNSGDVVHRTIHLENQGGSDLVFDTSVQLNSGATVTQYPELELKKDEEDPRLGVLGSGGPDMYGYVWRDSFDPDGPAFDWVDIVGIGTPITNLTSDDQNSGPIAMGFNFPFYGQEFGSVRVVTNGWLSFTDTGTDLSNDPLPNTGSPANLLAVFHDDLHFRSAVRAYYYNDGSRFIVQYNDVDKYSPSGAHLTFQVILYPNGRIVYQYLTMTGTLNSATIGIQNAAKTDGLMVSYNTDYVQAGLAVEFNPPFIWPQVTPSSGTIPPGGFMDLDVTLDAAGLLGGDYLSTILIDNNDPANARIDIPVFVHVVGTPDIDVTPNSLLFPTTFVGFSSSLPVQIRNTGTDAVVVTDLQMAGEFSYSGVTLPLTVAPGRTETVTVNFTPLDEGTRLGSLTVVSNDPDEPAIPVALQGDALIPPEIHVTPPAIHTALPPGGSRHKNLVINNAGGSDLIWEAATNLISAQGVVTPGTFLSLGKDDLDPREGILGTGGPDLFGYSWIDSNEPGGPIFDWVDITGVGTPVTQLTGDDQNVAGVPIGFAFPFYGNSFTTVNFCTNGWISFSSTLTAYSNQPLPNTSTSVPRDLIAPFWDDLHFRGAVHAYFYNDGSRFIVQYNDVDKYSPSGAHLTFQVILYPNGTIRIQYLTMEGTLNSATVGIQNSLGDDGLQVAYNADYIQNNLAIEFRKIPDWVRIDPTSGVIPEDGSQNQDALLDAAGLEDGIHEATIIYQSNDPYTPVLEVPVVLNVGFITPALTEFIPKVVRLGDSSILRVRMTVELPPNLNPHDIGLESVRFNDTVPALAHPAPYYTDNNRNGIEEVTFYFDWDLARQVLAEGIDIPVTIMGEVTDVQWWRGTAFIHTGDPEQYMPVGGAYYAAGATVPVRWNHASDFDHIYTVSLSRDGGLTWETLATQVTGNSFDWTVAGAPTSNAIIRVTSYDLMGKVIGYDDTDAPFTLAGTLLRPRPVDGATLAVTLAGTQVQVNWKAPASDLAFGPADRFRVLRGTDPRNMVEVATVTSLQYLEDASATAGWPMVYYRIVAANAAGEAQE